MALFPRIFSVHATTAAHLAYEPSEQALISGKKANLHPGWVHVSIRLLMIYSTVEVFC